MANRVDGVGSPRARQKNLANANRFQTRNVLRGNDAAREDRDVRGALLLEEPHDLGKEHIVRAGENREADGIDIFLHGRGDDLLRSLTQPGVDHFHARIAQRACDHLRAAIVTVEAGLGDQHPDFSFAQGFSRKIE